MYKALKSAQNDIQEALLKFADEAASVSPLAAKADTSRCPRGEPCQCALMTQSVNRQPSANDTNSKLSPVEFNERFQGLESSLEFLHQKQNSQYEILVKSVQELNVSMANVVKLLIHQAESSINTATIIPNLSPQAQASDLKNVCVDVSHVGVLPTTVEVPQTLETPREIDEMEEDQSAIEGDITPDIEEEEDADVEEEEVVPEEEEGIEVEEWTYKGRKFFKDSDNKVYANDNGEIGDAIGLYDPVKNIVKKIPAA
jgi:hypothetical protein